MTDPYDPDGAGPWSRPEWQIDRRHAEWLCRELMTGRYERVLEIGSYHGYSTTAFLHALKAGTVSEVHLCDVVIRPELRRLLDRHGPDDRIVVHECRSTTLLVRDARFDLVFVDGDHSLPTVAEEASLLLAAGVPAVFAHDTSAAGAGYAACEGPAHLKAALAAAGYDCREDAEARPGEFTHRGMLFARKRGTGGRLLFADPVGTLTDEAIGRAETKARDRASGPPG